MKSWTVYRFSRARRRCDTRTWGCRGIAARERYSCSSVPPGSDLGNEGWWHLSECGHCATTYGRPFPPVGGEQS